MPDYPLPMSWEEVLNLPDLLDHQILVCQPFEIYRGPLQAIKTPEHTVVLVAEWLAHFIPPIHRYVKWKDNGHEECELPIDCDISQPLNLGYCIQLSEINLTQIHLVPPSSLWTLHAEDVVIPGEENGQ